MKGWQWLLVVVLLVVVAGGAVVAVRKLSDSEAARLAKLQPEARAAIEQLRQAAAAEGIETFVGSTLRDADEQAAKVAAGVSTTDRSWHRLGLASEVYVMAPDATGKLQPDMKVEKPGSREKYRRLHKISKRFGLNGIPYTGEDGGAPFTASGDPAKLSNGVWDVGHFEFRGRAAGAYNADKSALYTWDQAAKRLGVA